MLLIPKVSVEFAIRLRTPQCEPSGEGAAVCACADELFVRITSHCATVTITVALRYRYLLIIYLFDFVALGSGY